MQVDATARVALESTLISHGLPWPLNRETAREAEESVRAAGAEPFTIAVIDGEARIGIAPEELERLARPGADAWKVGRRDLAAAVSGRRLAATTVSATAFLARRAGIGVLATGGLGGVHRGAATSFDVSADLDELAHADGLVVVCSGVKSILDVPATLEKLETLGVAVVGYGTREFPAFTCRASGLELESSVDTVEEAVALVAAHRRLGLPGAIVLAQPVPEEAALSSEESDRVLDAALRDAESEGVRGKSITPYLLDRVRLATEGRSLAANRALIVENARLAGRLAVALARR